MYNSHCVLPIDNSMLARQQLPHHSCFAVECSSNSEKVRGPMILKWRLFIDFWVNKKAEDFSDNEETYGWPIIFHSTKKQRV